MAFNIWSFKGGPFVLEEAQNDDAPWSKDSSIDILVNVWASAGEARFELVVVYVTISVTCWWSPAHWLPLGVAVMTLT
jgi:hypothetical protein